MIVRCFDLYRYRLPLAAPLSLPGETVRERAGLLVRLEGDGGFVGWGEASPLPGFSREGLGEAERDLHAIQGALVGQALPDHPVDPGGAFARAMDARGLSASARFAVEEALWDLSAAVRGCLLPEMITPRPCAAVALGGLLAGPPEEALAEARQMRDAGYRAVKLKVGRRTVRDEVALVHALSDVLGADVGLRLDANRAWTLEEALAFADGIAGVPVAYLEEPLADPAHLPAFAARCAVPVALDESLVGMEAAELDRHAYARAVILKPTLLGGPVPALRLARRAAGLGMTPVLSAAFETGVGLRCLVALAAALGGVPAGFDTYRRLADDVLTPRLEMDRETIDVAAVLNVERRIRQDLLEEWRIGDRGWWMEG